MHATAPLHGRVYVPRLKSRERVYVDARRGCLPEHKQRNLVIDVHASVKRHRRNDQLFSSLPAPPPRPRNPIATVLRSIESDIRSIE